MLSLHSSCGRGRPRKQHAASHDSNQTVKRGRGRPRKHPIEATAHTESATNTSVARRSIGQRQAVPTSKKRKADVAFGGIAQQASELASKKSRISPAAKPGGNSGARRVRPDFPNLLSSPVSSSSLHDGDETQTQDNSSKVIRSTFTSQAEQPQPKVRRQIVQDDDDISAIVRQMSG